ncbi:CPBP family intramembrane metalloprotease [Hoyosella sp. G463]|uniref:CPBP family intramembrane metalloprotease n=1 Tax=Lolliginicoccus lacisalsi TaxID=2742202 RepID=A0A927PMK5_9ACTN|nr:CPBP family intramembrane metalloprotease [Lolliginicoccus lacisalsi]
MSSWREPPLHGFPGRASNPAEARALRIEIVIVLAVTLGLQGFYSAISFTEALLAPAALAEQSVALNASRSQSGLIDFLRQLASALRLLAWATLGGYLLWRSGALARAQRFLRPRAGDLLPGAVLAALIGLPGLWLYFTGRALGITVEVVPAALPDAWWSVAMLVLSAIANSAAEEILVVVYLLVRLHQIGMRPWAAVAVSAALRGLYHLYQGIGSFGGNIVMGIIFARYFPATSRAWPLVTAHALIDIVAFVGYAMLR